MSKARKILLETEMQDPVKTCPAHRRLVDVLLNVDARILRLEILVFITMIASLGAGGKTIWDLLKRVLSG